MTVGFHVNGIVRELIAECLGKAELDALLWREKGQIQADRLAGSFEFPQPVSFEIKVTDLIRNDRKVWQAAERRISHIDRFVTSSPPDTDGAATTLSRPSPLLSSSGVATALAD